MATYAIGDVQGCFDELKLLLRQIDFRERSDKLWFVGDLVNRGPKSLEVLRFVRGLGSRAVTVLGNHDLHLITQFEGFERPRRDDTFQDVLRAPDARELVDWLRAQPLLHAHGEYLMVHAGVLPTWTAATAVKLGREVARALTAPDYRDFLKHMYGSKPETWSESLRGWDRLRVVVNAMTRMRFCTRGGKMEFRAKGAEPPAGYLRWFEAYKGRKTVVFGHWSQLGMALGRRYAGLDSGCVWGGRLTALRLEDRALFQVPCRGYQSPGE
jgi:bis(5'-nucleosyl)-tetraphosphatase (symmetrical)